MVLFDPHGNYLLGAEIALATRQGRQIKNERRLQRPPAAMKEACDIVLRSHPSAKVRSLSSVYNCMGMVFAARRTYVDPDQLPIILEDDGYRPVARDLLVPGDVVVNRDATSDIVHVGIVAEVRPILSTGSREVIVLSQWGGDGEYFHTIDDVNPRLGKATDFYTDREGVA